MLNEDVKKMLPMQRFLYWIEERYKIHLKRWIAGKPKPWTDDEVMQNVFFTMPYREMDKTTLWFKDHIRLPLNYDAERVLFATVCFRWFNYIPTGRLLLAETSRIEDTVFCDWNVIRCKNILRGQDKIFTGAFNISNGGSTKPKLCRVTEDYIQPIWDDRKRILDQILSGGEPTMQKVHKILTKYAGFGGKGFMAYEVVCDLRYTCLLEDAPDKCEWTNMGPGARRGINRLFDRPINTPLSKKWLDDMQYILVTVQAHFGDTLPEFEMREIEHSLCEFDKAERARFGEGHIKRKYNGNS